MKIRIVSLLSVLAAAVMPLHAQQCMTWDEAYRRADSLAARLTLDEKISMMRGYDKFFLPGVPDKGMPYIFTSDATQGLRLNLNLPDPTMIRQIDRSTAFPSPIMLAATFSPEMAYEYARAVGEECRASGVEVLLGPGMNIYRNSQCSRNFEYLGEDPYLAARMVERYVEGMQSTGTLACLKHFLANNTEWYRRRSNSIVDERAIHEIYTPAFVAGIEAGAATVMTAYNRLNGEWCGQSEYVINDLLRGEFGFRGLVMSDWRSIYDWGKVVASGLNVDMPGEDYFYLDGDIRGRVERGEFSESDIDRMIRPTIATAIAFGLYDRILSGDKYRPELLDSLPSHARTAYEVAAEGTVLLRNDGILPLDASGRSILLTGRWLDELPRGGGAARVEGYDTVTPVDALKALGDVTVSKNPTDEELRNFPWYDTYAFLGGSFGFLLMLAVLNFIHVDGKPVVNAGEELKNGAMWGIVVIIGCFSLLGNAMADAELGIRAWIISSLSPVFGGMGLLPLLILIAVIITFATNFCNGLPLVLACNSAVLPFICELELSTGISSSAVATMINLCANMAFLTYAGTIYSSLILGREEIDQKWVWGDAIKILPAFMAVCFVVCYALCHILP